MLSLCVFIFLFSFAVPITEWRDESLTLQTFDSSYQITGIAVDSSGAYRYTTLTEKTSALNYLYNSNQGGLSKATTLTHLDSVWRFSNKNKIFYCTEKENLLFI